jgi:murein L,D-transpeptidase YafK
MKSIRTFFALFLGMLLLAGCQGAALDDLAPNPNRELPQKILTLMKAKGMRKNSPIMMRIFKNEHVLEIWKQKDNGRYDMIANYNICAWSGTLGPKVKQGDRQAPEGYYTIRPYQMNPNSKYFLAINTGFPNAYDRANGRNGADLMIHGACSSSGCYSMTDANVQEIFAFARDAFAGGQKEFMLEALPFRMTAANMAQFSSHPDYKFWQMIKEGYDYFELTHTPPKVDFCEKKYVFNRVAAGGKGFNATGACPMSIPASQNFEKAYEGYEAKFESSYAQASKKFDGVAYPIVHGGASRPLTKKWQPQPIAVTPPKPLEAAKLVPLDIPVAPVAVATTPVDGVKPVVLPGVPAPATVVVVAPTPATSAPVAVAPAAEVASAPAVPATKPDATAVPDVEPAKVDAAKAEVAPSATAKDGAIPVPTANPNAEVAAEATVPVVKKKKKHWWQKADAEPAAQ